MKDDLILLDTTVIVDYLRGDNKVIAYFNMLPNTPTISLITEAEIYQGAKNTAELTKWGKFLSKLIVLPITPDISHLAISLLKKHRLSHGLHILDTFIASTSIIHNYTLVTANAKHFQIIKDLRLESWPPPSIV